MITKIPVYINGKYVFNYHLWNLFDKHGNGDGEAHILLAVAELIINFISNYLDYEVETPNTLHNDYSIIALRKGDDIVWENYFWEDAYEKYNELWATLPEDVKKLFEHLAREGVYFSV